MVEFFVCVATKSHQPRREEIANLTEVRREVRVGSVGDHGWQGISLAWVENNSLNNRLENQSEKESTVASKYVLFCSLDSSGGF